MVPWECEGAGLPCGPGAQGGEGAKALSPAGSWGGARAAGQGQMNPGKGVGLSSQPPTCIPTPPPKVPPGGSPLRSADPDPLPGRFLLVFTPKVPSGLLRGEVGRCCHLPTTVSTCRRAGLSLTPEGGARGEKKRRGEESEKENGEQKGRGEEGESRRKELGLTGTHLGLDLAVGLGQVPQQLWASFPVSAERRQGAQLGIAALQRQGACRGDQGGAVPPSPVKCDVGPTSPGLLTNTEKFLHSPRLRTQVPCAPLGGLGCSRPRGVGPCGVGEAAVSPRPAWRRPPGAPGARGRWGPLPGGPPGGTVLPVTDRGSQVAPLVPPCR